MGEFMILKEYEGKKVKNQSIRNVEILKGKILNAEIKR